MLRRGTRWLGAIEGQSSGILQGQKDDHGVILPCQATPGIPWRREGVPDLADHADILLVGAVVASPRAVGAIPQGPLLTPAADVVQPDAPSTGAKAGPSPGKVANFPRCPTAQLPANHRRVGPAPAVIADCAPLPSMVHLQPPGAAPGATHQPQLEGVCGDIVVTPAPRDTPPSRAASPHAAGTLTLALNSGHPIHEAGRRVPRLEDAVLQGRLLPSALHLPQHHWGSAGRRGAAGRWDEPRATAGQLAAQHLGSRRIPALGTDGAPGASKEELQAPGTA